MSLKAISITLALVASAAASFTVPQGQADGVYMVSEDANGGEAHVFLGNETEPAHQKRFNFPGGTNVKCGDFVESLPLLDWTAADAQFSVACDAAAKSGQRYTNKGKAIYSVSGTVVVYMCNYSSKGNPCALDEYTQAKANIRSTCTFGGSNGVEAGELLRTLRRK